MSILLDSALIAGAATLAALLLGYPAAWAITRAAPRWQTRLLVLVMLPFWSNYLIRTYAWIVLLNREGLVSRGLVDSGLIDEPVSLLYTAPSVVVGLVYNYLPFVILSIYASLQRLDPSVVEASEDLGAPPWRTFVRVVLPLTMPGVAAGAVFVFVLSIGNFITPDLLGGGRRRHGRQPHLRSVPLGARLAVRRGAVAGADRDHDGAAVRAGRGGEPWPLSAVGARSPRGSGSAPCCASCTARSSC